MTKGRIQGTIYQVRRLRDDELRKGQNDLMAALGARKSAQDMARRWEVYSWDSTYYEDTHPERAADLLRHTSILQGHVVRFSAQQRRYEAEAAEHLATARKAAAALARAEHKAAPRQPWDLWVLFQVCWQGWLAQRGKPVLY